MENDENVPLSEYLIDELAREAVEAGFTGRGVDGFVSATIEQRGLEVLKKLTQQTQTPSVADVPQQNNSVDRSS